MAIVSMDELGFHRERLIGIKAAIDASVTEKLGPVNTGADSVIGQYNGAISESIDIILETMEIVYFSMYPYSASGTSLDNAVSFVGMTRNPATYTSVIATCYGDDGTDVPVGTKASTTNNRIYASISSGSISLVRCNELFVEVSQVVAGATYKITVDGTVMEYVAVSGDDAAKIITELSKSLVSNTLASEVSGATLRVYSMDRQTSHKVSVSTNINVTSVGSPFVFRAQDIGSNPLPVGSLTKVIDTVSGLDSINNPAPANEGVNPESDAELRSRHSVGVRSVGNASVNAIRARLLQDVSGVTSVSVYENRSNLEVGGMPAHSVECVVAGGFEHDVAVKIYESKAAGIETYGNLSKTIVDENGDNQVVKFSRPNPKYIWVKISGTKDSEGSLPTDYKDSIIKAVVNYGSSLGVGEDVIRQKLFIPIFNNVSGIASLDIQIAATDSKLDTPVYGIANIPIGRSETSAFETSLVTVQDFM